MYSAVSVEGKLYEALVDRKLHFRNKPDHATMLHQGSPARAVKKLQEALLAAGLQLTSDMRVIDVGE